MMLAVVWMDAGLMRCMSGTSILGNMCDWRDSELPVLTPTSHRHQSPAPPVRRPRHLLPEPLLAPASMAVACVASSSSSSHRQHAHTVTQATSSAILKQAVPAWTPLLRQVANTSAPYSERSSSCGTITPVKSKAPWVDQFLPIVVDGHQTIGVEKARTALVVVDMQK